MQPGSADPDQAGPITSWELRRAAADLIRDSRTVEAEALLLEGEARFPEDPQIFIDRAAIAEAARNWPEALERFEAMLQRFPDNGWACLRVAVLLRQVGRVDEAERVLEQGQRRMFGEVGLFIEYATISEARQDWPQALERFRRVSELFPDNWWAFARMGIALRNMNRLDEAERVLQDGQRAVPGERALFIDYGTIAELRQDWPEALRRFEVVNERFPDGWWSYARMAIALRHLGRPDEAERILERGQELIPDERALFIDYGTIAELRQDWPEALRRFEVVNQRFPDEWWAYARMAIALRNLGRLDEAERVLERGQEQVPHERALFSDHATIAELRGDWPEALRRSRAVTERFPDDWWSYARMAIALRHLDRLDEAERILEQGQARCAHERALFIDHGEIAELRGDWPEALRRFEGVRQRFPDGWWAGLRIGTALRHMDRLDEAERDPRSGTTALSAGAGVADRARRGGGSPQGLAGSGAPVRGGQGAVPAGMVRLFPSGEVAAPPGPGGGSRTGAGRRAGAPAARAGDVHRARRAGGKRLELGGSASALHRAARAVPGQLVGLCRPQPGTWSRPVGSATPKRCSWRCCTPFRNGSSR